MEIQKDFRDLLALLNARLVEYVIVGGYALAFHGAPRSTGDLDIYINPTHHNAELILGVLGEFGFGSLGLRLSDFTRKDNVVQLGFPPVRIDIITSLTGVDWDEVHENAVTSRYGDVVVRFMGRNELIKNKRAIGRHRDLADIEALGEK